MPDFVPVMGNSVCVAFNLVSVFESVHLELVMVLFRYAAVLQMPSDLRLHIQWLVVPYRGAKGISPQAYSPTPPPSLSHTHSLFLQLARSD